MARRPEGNGPTLSRKDMRNPDDDITMQEAQAQFTERYAFTTALQIPSYTWIRIIV
jgi:hypothetical protein